MASIVSPVVKDDGGEKKVGMVMSLVDCPESSYLEGVQNCCPTIRELVGDLDKSWGNFKDWMLQLRDGRQIVIPLSLYRSPGSESDCSVMEGEATTGNFSCVTKGQIVSWADECDGVVDSLSVATGSEDEICEFDERSMTWEKGDEPLVVETLATEAPLEIEGDSGEEVGCKENIDSKLLSRWVTKRIKDFQKSVGTSLEGFEEQIMGLFLALEARKNKNKKQQIMVGSPKKLIKSGQKGQWELKNLMSSFNVDYGSAKLRSVSSERAIVVRQ